VKFLGFLNNAGIGLIQKNLDAVWLRKETIANNIANNETPGYKSKYVEFEQQLKNALNRSVSKDSLQKELENIKPKILQNDNTTAKEDGNNVDLDAENIEMARTQLQYEYLIRVLNTQMNNIKYAINGGK
jgi:flagellar basal-body rod protein FlgB